MIPKSEVRVYFKSFITTILKLHIISLIHGDQHECTNFAVQHSHYLSSKMYTIFKIQSQKNEISQDKVIVMLKAAYSYSQHYASSSSDDCVRSVIGVIMSNSCVVNSVIATIRRDNVHELNSLQRGLKISCIIPIHPMNENEIVTSMTTCKFCQ